MPSPATLQSHNRDYSRTDTQINGIFQKIVKFFSSRLHDPFLTKKIARNPIVQNDLWQSIDFHFQSPAEKSGNLADPRPLAAGQEPHRPPQTPSD